MAKAKRDATLAAAAKELLDYAYSLPGAWPDQPWPGDFVAKVGKKVFVFSGWLEDTWGLSVKLVTSHAEASALPFTEPTGYGLGKAGWVSARFAPGETVMIDLFKRWIRESYLQVAPKKLAAQIDAAPAPAKKPAPKKPAPKKKPVAKKAAAKKKPAPKNKPAPKRRSA